LFLGAARTGWHLLLLDAIAARRFWLARVLLVAPVGLATAGAVYEPVVILAHS